VELDWPALVEDRNAWVAHNFPNSTLPNPGESVLGCLEEAGELAHADLKQRQAIRGDSAKHISDAQDAVGDLMVYLMGVMSFAKYVPQSHFVPIGLLPINAGEALFRVGQSVGSLCKCYVTQQEYAMPINKITYYARRYCSFRGWEFEVIVTNTWNHVRERDWIKYPGTGLPPVEEHATAG